MKKILLLTAACICTSWLSAQFVYKIKADSVQITNDSCNAELIIENSTKHVLGFLYNKGNGRTEFRASTGGGFFNPNQVSTGHTSHDANYKQFSAINFNNLNFRAGTVASNNYTDLFFDSTYYHIGAKKGNEFHELTLEPANHHFLLRSYNSTESNIEGRPDSLMFVQSAGDYRFKNIAFNNSSNLRMLVLDTVNGRIYRQVIPAGGGGGSTPTLQQVFNTEVGGSVLTKTDSIQTGSNILKVFGATTHGFDGLFQVNQTSTGRAMRIEGGSGLYIHPSSGTSGLNVEATSGGSNIISTTGGGIPVWAQGFSGSLGIVSSIYTNTSGSSGLLTNIQMERSITSGSITHYAGETIDFRVRLMDGTASVAPIRLAGRWKNATGFGNAESEFMVLNFHNTVTDTTLRILGTGQLTLDKYTSGGSFKVDDTTNYKPMVTDANGVQYRFNHWPGGGGGVGSQTLQQTFNTEVGGNVLTKLDTILTGAFGLRLQSSTVSANPFKVVTTANSSTAVWGETSGNNVAGYFQAVNGIGVEGIVSHASNGVGVWGQANGGTAIFAQTTGDNAELFEGLANQSNTNTNRRISIWTLNSSGTVAQGFGQEHQYLLETDFASSTLAAKFDVSWDNVTHANRTTWIDYRGMNNAVEERFMNIQHDLVRINNDADTLATKAYARSVGGGGGSGLGDPGGNGFAVRTALNTTIARTLTGTANRIVITNGNGVGGNPTFDVGTDLVDVATSHIYAAGAKQTFQQSSTTAGINIGNTADPSTPANGDIWNNNTNGLTFRNAGATRIVADLNSAQTLTNKSIDASQLTGTVATARLSNVKQAKGITIVSPTSSENATIWYTTQAITIEEVRGIMLGSSQSVTLVVNYGSSRASASGTIVASNTFDSGDSGYQTTGFPFTLNTTSIPAGSYIWITTSATSGTINDLNLTITYRQQ